ncbi:hypothetical protein [Rathayibacter sp. YIM 133350]|uniref:hypothetical protein n=1 Tax=Rathayibacter sp. YIM 133350 TaxID=3131992 RepID=UPI003FCFF4FB
MKPPVKVWDLVSTIVLLVLLVLVAGAACVLSFFLAFASDPCGGSVVCDYDRMAAGFWIALIGPVAAAVLALAAAIVLLVLRRIAFWVPLGGIVLVVAVFSLGAWLVLSGVPRATS